MTTVVCVYDSHRAAVDSARKLKESGFPVNKVSIIGSADKLEEVVEETREAADEDITKKAGRTVGIGAGLGAAVGVLTGIGVFMIPGLGLLYGAGALVGALAGANFGMISGGAVSVLRIAGMKDEDVHRLEDHIKQGRFLVFVEGDVDEAKKARELVEATCKPIEAHSFS